MCAGSISKNLWYVLALLVAFAVVKMNTAAPPAGSDPLRTSRFVGPAK